MKYLIITILTLAAIRCEAQRNNTLAEKLLQQEKLYWTATSDSVRLNALLTKAMLNRDAGLYANALHETNRAEALPLNHYLEAEVEYQKMVIYFLWGRYDICCGITIDSSAIATHYNNYLVMELYSLNETEQWSLCKTILLRHCRKSDTLLTTEIENLPVSFKYKSPEKARKLSAFLPGLGETYAGYPLKGFTSLVLNGGFLFFGAYNVYTGYYITGGVFGIFPFLRFYSGGKKLSYTLAEKHNQRAASLVKKQYWEEINAIVH